MGRFDSRRWWTVLPLIPFTTPHNRGFRISAFCGELQKAEFERNVIRKRTLAGQRKLLELYDYHACAGDERAALSARADQVVRISAKPIYVFQALVQYLETHRVVAPGYSILQDVVSRALGKERGRLTSLLDTRLDEGTRKALDRLYLERDGGYGVTPLKQDPKDFSRSEMRREMARCRSAGASGFFHLGETLWTLPYPSGEDKQ